MTRKKVKLAFITNDSARKATYNKRKKGLMKKVSELSILCGIDACAIIYSPYESTPEVWPNALGVQHMISQFKRMPEMEQTKKMVNHESFIRQRIGKANEQLKKQQKENSKKEMTEAMYQCLTGRGLQNMTVEDLNDLRWLLDQKLKQIRKRIESQKKMAPHESVAHPPALPPGPPAQPPITVAPNDLTMNGIQRPQWFTQLMYYPGENMGFGHGDEMIVPFHANHNPTWSSAFFP